MVEVYLDSKDIYRIGAKKESEILFFFDIKVVLFLRPCASKTEG
jgi:hypothetical protein